MRILTFLGLLASVEVLHDGKKQCNQRLSERRLRCLERRKRQSMKHVKEDMDVPGSTTVKSEADIQTIYEPAKIVSPNKIVFSFTGFPNSAPRGMKILIGEIFTLMVSTLNFQVLFLIISLLRQPK